MLDIVQMDIDILGQQPTKPWLWAAPLKSIGGNDGSPYSIVPTREI